MTANQNDDLLPEVALEDEALVLEISTLVDIDATVVKDLLLRLRAKKPEALRILWHFYSKKGDSRATESMQVAFPAECGKLSAGDVGAAFGPTDNDGLREALCGLVGVDANAVKIIVDRLKVKKVEALTLAGRYLERKGNPYAESVLLLAATLSRKAAEAIHAP